MQPSFMSNMTLDEKQNGCDKSKMGRKFEQKRKAKWLKKTQIWSRPTSKHPIYELSSAYAADFLKNGKLHDIT